MNRIGLACPTQPWAIALVLAGVCFAAHNVRAGKDTEEEVNLDDEDEPAFDPKKLNAKTTQPITTDAGTANSPPAASTSSPQISSQDAGPQSIASVPPGAIRSKVSSKMLPVQGNTIVEEVSVDAIDAAVVLPEYDRRSWFILLPLLALLVVAWNVDWRDAKVKAEQAARRARAAPSHIKASRNRGTNA